MLFTMYGFVSMDGNDTLAEPLHSFCRWYPFYSLSVMALYVIVAVLLCLVIIRVLAYGS